MLAEKELKRVLVVSGSEKGNQALCQFFPTADFSTIITTNNASDARRKIAEEEFNLVIVNTPLNDEFGTDFATQIAENGYVGVVLLARSDIYDNLVYKLERYGVLVVSKPTTKSSVMQAVNLLNAVQSLLNNAKRKVSNLQRKIDEIQLVNRAKLLLMEKLDKSESEAHRFIEKQAMDMRKTRTEVAREIIETYDN